MPADGSIAVGETEIIRVVNQRDISYVPGASGNYLYSPELQWGVITGQTWAFDAMMYCSGPPGYVAGFSAAVVGGTTAANYTLGQFFHYGPTTTLALFQESVNVNNGGFVVFGRFDMSGANNHVAVNIRGTIKLTGSGILYPVVIPVTQVAGNLTLLYGSSLFAYRVD